MRVSIALILVACGGNPPPTHQTPAIRDAGIDAAVIADAAPVAVIDDPSLPTTSQAPVPRGLDKDQIRDAIRAHTSELVGCYQKRSPDTLPALHIKFTIDPHGRVTKASATNLHGESDTCVVEVLEAMQFPKPAGGATVTVNYPLDFDPVAGQ